MRANEEIVFTIIVVIIILVFLAIVFLVALARHNQRRNQLHSENQKIKKEFEETLLNTQLEIQEQTLTHISQEIHDNIGQVLTLARLQLHTASAQSAEEGLEHTDQLLGKAIQDLRALSHSLHTNSIKEYGFSTALQNLLSQFEKTGKYKVSFIEEEVLELSDERSLILFRIVQEVLNNIVKHANASEIRVLIAKEDGNPYIRIEDDGKGFDSQHQESLGKGIGMKNISQRANVIGAKLSLFSQKNKGTIVTITL